jgi:hypothetical protein
MDPRERADAALARARARGAFVVTPDDAVSPMDAASTLQIPRAVVHAAEQSESTGRVLPTGASRGHHPPQQPMQQQQLPPQQQHPQPTQYLQPVQSHQPPQPAQQQGHPPQRGHQTGPHQPVPYPGPPQQQQQQPARPEPQPEPQYDEPPRQLDGLVPTTQQPGTQRSMMSRRLDGH